MSSHQGVQRDERTVAVENAGYRWAYGVVTFALLIDVVIRAMVRDEAAWDLMAMVVVGGIVCMIYQARKNALPHGWVMLVLLVMCVTALIALLGAAGMLKFM